MPRVGTGERGPLVGRDVPLGALVDAIRNDRSTVVVGEAGIGKTSLVRAGAAAAGRQIHEGGGFATLTWMPYLALRRALGAPLGGDATRVAEAVERHVGPDVLFVDDLQWVDRESMAAFRVLAGRILMLAAVRAGDEGAPTALAACRDAGMTEVSLEGLDAFSAGTLVRRISPDITDRSVDQIVARSAGNPLVLEELAALGEPSPVLARALASRVRRLSPAARTAIEVLAIADGPLRRARLGRGTAEAIREGLAVDRGDRVEIRHALLAEVLRSEMTEATRRRLHERAARAVDEPVRAARHLTAAGRVDEAAARAGAALLEAGDPLERAELLGVVGDVQPPTAPLEARLAAARAFDELSDWLAVERVLGPEPVDRPAAETAERDLLLAHAAYGLGRHDDARRLLERADTRTLDPASSVAGRRAIEAARFAVNVDGAVAAAIGRIDADGAGQVDPATAFELRALRESIMALAGPSGDLAFLRGTSDLALAAGRFRGAADQARVVHYALLMHEGAIPALDWLLDRRRAFGAAGVVGLGLEFQAEAVTALILGGRLTDAVTAADEVLEQPAPLRARQAATICRAQALTLLGRFDAAATGLAELGDQVTGDYFGAGQSLAVQAELALWSGLPLRAAEQADRATAIRSPVPGVDAGVGLIRDWARWETGADPGPEPAPPPTRSLAGVVPEARAIRRLHAGDDAGAAIDFAEAAASWAGFHAVRELVCRWAEGEALRRAGGDNAVDRLRATLAAAEAIGFEPLAARTRRSLRLAGVRVSIAPRGAGGASLQLTGREREIVDLVERGLTNVEIARRLGLGRPTVARILASAMSKLGAGRRNQLAGLRGVE